MKKIFYLLLFVFVFASENKAQNLITVEHGIVNYFYTRLDSALIRAVNGDKIYLPGGSYPGFQLNKSINIIGVGYDIDSTVSTNPTFISGGIDILTGSSGATFDGLMINSTLNFGNSATNNIVSNIIFRRCKLIGSISVNSYTGSNNTSNNCSFIENIIGGVSLGNYSYSFFFTNNIFTDVVTAGNQSTFKNNIFTRFCSGCFYTPSVYSMSNCTFQNNIIRAYSVPSCYGNNTYNNNWGVPNGILSCYDGFGMNNINSPTTFDSIFVQPWNNFIPTSFILKVLSPLKNAGTDGSDIGIFGGAYPWKIGSLPANPHVQFKSIAPKTNDQNTLPVLIKVKAQDN